jgi:hypothetical protein
MISLSYESLVKFKKSKLRKIRIMKIVNSIIVALAFCLLANANAYSETIHQTVRGEAAAAPDGGTALSKKLIETKSIPGAETVARLVGPAKQWAYVSFWFGIPAPAGKSVIRFKVYVDDTATADYGVYARLKTGQTFLAKLVVPADAKKNSFVDIDIPVDSPAEWNGASLKKMDTSDKPSPWIDSVSVVLP